MLQALNTNAVPQIHNDAAVLNVLNQFDFWSAVPLNGSASYGDIAKHTNLPEEAVRRFLRHSMTLRLFAPEAPGSDQVVHTSTTAFIAKNPNFQSWLAHNMEEALPATTKLPEALRRFSSGKEALSEELEETAFALEFKQYPAGQSGKLWDFLANYGEGPAKGYRLKRFAEAMRATHQASAVDFPGIINKGFDWEGLGNGLVVDVSLP